MLPGNSQGLRKPVQWGNGPSGTLRGLHTPELNAPHQLGSPHGWTGQDPPGL